MHYLITFDIDNIKLDIDRDIQFNTYGITIRDYMWYNYILYKFSNNTIYKTVKLEDYIKTPIESLMICPNKIIVDYLDIYHNNYYKYNSIVSEYVNFKDNLYTFTSNCINNFKIQLDYLRGIIIIDISGYNAYYTLDRFLNVLFMLMKYKTIYEITYESFYGFFKKMPSTGSHTKKAINKI